ncbi:unnamed protein product [Arctogadus glacialis]
MKEGKHERSGPPRVHRGELVRLEPTRSCLEPTAALVSLNRGAFCSRTPPTLGSRREPDVLSLGNGPGNPALLWPGGERGRINEVQTVMSKSLQPSPPSPPPNPEKVSFLVFRVRWNRVVRRSDLFQLGHIATPSEVRGHLLRLLLLSRMWTI